MVGDNAVETIQHPSMDKGCCHPSRPHHPPSTKNCLAFSGTKTPGPLIRQGATDENAWGAYRLFHTTRTGVPSPDKQSVAHWPGVSTWTSRFRLDKPVELSPPSEGSCRLTSIYSLYCCPITSPSFSMRALAAGASPPCEPSLARSRKSGEYPNKAWKGEKPVVALTALSRTVFIMKRGGCSRHTP